MGVAAILFNGVEPFKQIMNILSTECPVWNLERNAQAVSKAKTFKDSIIYTCI